MSKEVQAYLMHHIKHLVNRIKCENGNIMLMALMIFLIFSILGTTIISVAGMEKKISQYSYMQEQAQQAADAGVEWAIEMIYEAHLKDQVFEDEDPDCPSGFSSILTTQSMEDNPNIQWTISNCSCTTDSENNRFLYTFDSTGTYKNANAKKVRVTVGYIYNSETGERNIRMVDDFISLRGIVSYTLVPGT